MKYQHLCISLCTCLIYSLSATDAATAQVTADDTLSTQVRRSDSDFVIKKGKRADDNLFHSFREFSVPRGSVAHFQNAPDIKNIISRVTGNSVSEINGLLRANHGANLFLLNPNGIIFGADAQLDIGGAFVASTANSLRFADGTEFSAREPQASALLSVSVPIGVQFGEKPGAIALDSQTGFALEVDSQKTIALIGGDINFASGNYTISAGRVELGSVGSNSLVKLIPTGQSWALDYTSVDKFRDIQLSQRAILNSSSRSVNLQGRNVFLSGNSVIFNSLGNLRIAAAESVNILDSNIFTQSINNALTPPKNITVETKQLNLQNGGVISTGTLGSNPAGNLTINASESVDLRGISDFPSTLTTATEGTGAGGKLAINTGRLSVTNGAEISVSSFGAGKAGNLAIMARSVLLDRQGTIKGTTRSGNGGNVRLQNLDSLLLRRQSMISTNARGTGNGGNIIIDADLLAALDRSQIVATAVEGRGGNIDIKVEGLLLSPNSIIDASSELGLDGEVEINQTDAKPSNSLVELPIEVVDVENLVAQGCGAEGNLAGSRFVLTGRGGLPANSAETVTSTTILEDLGNHSLNSIHSTFDDEKTLDSVATIQQDDSQEIIEAQGWIKDANGKVILISQAPNQSSYSWLNSSTCRGTSSNTSSAIKPTN